MVDQYKLDIFKVLAELNAKNKHYFTSLSVDQQKSIVPLVIARWLSGTTSELQIILINELVNPYLFDLQKHPDLLWKLMASTTTTKGQRYKWNAAHPKSKAKLGIATKVVMEYFKYNSKDAARIVRVLPSTDIVEMAEELGWQITELNKLNTELGLTKIKSKTIGIKQGDFDFTEL